MSDLEYPADLKYTADHEWVKDLGSSRARVGITAFAQDALGDVVYVTLPQVGDRVETGGACGEIESTKSVSDILSPLEGEVVAINDQLEESPDLVNSDPYGEGWMFEIQVEGDDALGDLLDADAYQAQLD